MSMDDYYREYILDHYRNPRNYGTLENPTAHAEDSNPLCGDQLAIDLVVDWKTDVDPTAQQIELYREQMRDYLVATGAPDGLIVFVTTGKLVRVRPMVPLRSTSTRPAATQLEISFE